MSLKLPQTMSRKEILDGIRHLRKVGRAPFADSTRYDVLFESERFPPKAVVGLAASLSTGEQYTPYDFAGGLGSQCFRLLKQAGFTIVPKEGEVIFPEEVTAVSYMEGAVIQVKVNRYERDPKAREACLSHYGTVCTVCDLDFESMYGEVGAGFIHVHHLKPLGLIRKGYVVKPIEDLRPVCPNCHAMLHRRKKEPYSIYEMREVLAEVRRAAKRKGRK